MKSGHPPPGISETEGRRFWCILMTETGISRGAQGPRDGEALPMALHLTLLFALWYCFSEDWDCSLVLIN